MELEKNKTYEILHRGKCIRAIYVEDDNANFPYSPKYHVFYSVDGETMKMAQIMLNQGRFMTDGTTISPFHVTDVNITNSRKITMNRKHTDSTIIQDELERYTKELSELAREGIFL